MVLINFCCFLDLKDAEFEQEEDNTSSIAVKFGFHEQAKITNLSHSITPVLTTELLHLVWSKSEFH